MREQQIAVNEMTLTLTNLNLIECVTRSWDEFNGQRLNSIFFYCVNRSDCSEIAPEPIISSLLINRENIDMFHTGYNGTIHLN